MNEKSENGSPRASLSLGIFLISVVLFALNPPGIICQPLIVSGSARPLIEPGKIYIKDNLLFVNEQRRGIHVIDNQDPSKPKKISFLDIPGNVDIAIRDDILYADSRYDLVVIDITEPMQAAEVKRFKDVFPRVMPAPLRGSDCFPAGTEVLTAAGARAIETVEPGTAVYACDPSSGRWTSARVLKQGAYRYEGDLITIDDVRHSSD